jgi:hypothetical protein
VAEKHPNCIYPLCGCAGTSVCKHDPLNTPLPCDVQVGHMTFRKGVALRSLVLHANRLRDELHKRWADALTDATGVRACEASSLPKPSTCTNSQTELVRDLIGALQTALPYLEDGRSHQERELGADVRNLIRQAQRETSDGVPEAPHG